MKHSWFQFVTDSTSYHLREASSPTPIQQGDEPHPVSPIRGASTMTRQELDPVMLQIISGALDTIAEEMGRVLYRMSFSSIIRESQDLGAGLFDTDFNTLCESESTPLHFGSLPGYLAGIQETLQFGGGYGMEVVCVYRRT